MSLFLPFYVMKLLLIFPSKIFFDLYQFFYDPLSVRCTKVINQLSSSCQTFSNEIFQSNPLCIAKESQILGYLSLIFSLITLFY